jgi:steroid delta-isomerase-like uncharacterized protein
MFLPRSTLEVGIKIPGSGFFCGLEVYPMSKENKAMVRQTFEEIWNRGNFAVIDERFASDYIGHSVSQIRGPEGGKQFAAAIRSAFPDYQYTVEDEITEGDRVVHRWTVRGMHEGEFQGMPPSGKQIEMTGITIFRIANGKLIEGWTNKDVLGMLQQLGAVPARDKLGKPQDESHPNSN